MKKNKSISSLDIYRLIYLLCIRLGILSKLSLFVQNGNPQIRQGTPIFLFVSTVNCSWTDIFRQVGRLGLVVQLWLHDLSVDNLIFNVLHHGYPWPILGSQHTKPILSKIALSLPGEGFHTEWDIAVIGCTVYCDEGGSSLPSEVGRATQHCVQGGSGVKPSPPQELSAL